MVYEMTKSKSSTLLYKLNELNKVNSTTMILNVIQIYADVLIMKHGKRKIILVSPTCRSINLMNSEKSRTCSTCGAL